MAGQKSDLKWEILVENKEALEVARALFAFSLMPLDGCAKVDGKALRKVLQEMTGLSPATIAKGELDSLGPSAKKKVAIHQMDWLKEQAGDSQDKLTAIQRRIATVPNRASGGPAPWAGWVHMFEHLPELPLPRSKQVALVVDELIEALARAQKAGDVIAYRQVLLDHFERYGNPIRLVGEALEPLKGDTSELTGLNNWKDAGILTGKLIDNLYLDMLTALDVEWCGLAFGEVQVPPLFPLVMAKVKDGLELGVVPESKKNLFIRPTRRLLVFMHALLHKRYRYKWPTREASPKDLARALGLDASDLSNYFDGTRKLTLKKASNYWVELCTDLSKGKALLQEMPPLPEPLIWLAIYWQQILVKDKERSIILLDTKTYLAFWQRRHVLWMDQPKAKAIEWPSWLTGQSSSLS